MNAWISVKEKVPPPMETVILYYEGKVIVGWNESVQTEEDPSYCSWEIHLTLLDNERVTHWMPLPPKPRK